MPVCKHFSGMFEVVADSLSTQTNHTHEDEPFLSFDTLKKYRRFNPESTIPDATPTTLSSTGTLVASVPKALDSGLNFATTAGTLTGFVSSGASVQILGCVTNTINDCQQLWDGFCGVRTNQDKNENVQKILRSVANLTGRAAGYASAGVKIAGAVTHATKIADIATPLSNFTSLILNAKQCAEGIVRMVNLHGAKIAARSVLSCLVQLYENPASPWMENRNAQQSIQMQKIVHNQLAESTTHLKERLLNTLLSQNDLYALNRTQYHRLLWMQRHSSARHIASEFIEYSHQTAYKKLESVASAWFVYKYRPDWFRQLGIGMANIALPAMSCMIAVLGIIGTIGVLAAPETFGTSLGAAAVVGSVAVGAIGVAFLGYETSKALQSAASFDHCVRPYLEPATIKEIEDSVSFAHGNLIGLLRYPIASVVAGHRKAITMGDFYRFLIAKKIMNAVIQEKFLLVSMNEYVRNEHITLIKLTNATHQMMHTRWWMVMMKTTTERLINKLMLIAIWDTIVADHKSKLSELKTSLLKSIDHNHIKPFFSALCKKK